MMAKDTNSHGSRFDRAIADFKNHGGILHTAQALRSGIHPGTLYAMRDSRVLEMVSRGAYRLADSSARRGNLPVHTMNSCSTS